VLAGWFDGTDYFQAELSAKLSNARKFQMINLENLERRFDLVWLRPFELASLGIFAIGALAGGLAIVFYPETAEQLQDLLKQFARMFHGMSKLRLATAIFLNNSLKTLLVIVSGPLLGLAPIIFLVVNGAILGAVIPAAVESKGLWAALMTIVPHGIFELPAIFVGTSIGMALGVHPLRRLVGKADTTLLSALGHGLRVFVRVILPLLLLAAAIEVFVTPLIAGL
jgi:stage II sporulation protein M